MFSKMQNVTISWEYIPETGSWTFSRKRQYSKALKQGSKYKSSNTYIYKNFLVLWASINVFVYECIKYKWTDITGKKGEGGGRLATISSATQEMLMLKEIEQKVIG